MRNLPLGFGLVMAGAVLVSRGMEAFGSSFGGGGDSATTSAPVGGKAGKISTTGSAAANQRLARSLISSKYPQWNNATQWMALVRLWTQESGWTDKTNPSSGARGIPQALPATKMPAVALGHGPAAIRAQILWGLAYIHERYGSPAAAWQHEQANGWY